jgi:nucleoside-diphosphate-sugar epimerase
MKVLLVGGSGGVGTMVTPYLAARHELRVLDVRPPQHDVEYVEGSTIVRADVERALDGVDAFVNMTMKSPQGGWVTDQTLEEITDNYLLNTLGLHLLLHAAATGGVLRGVHTSTMSVHHRRRDWYPAEELVPLDTPSVYGLTKGLGERICEYFCRWFDLSIVALRITMPRTRQQWLELRGEQQYLEGSRAYPTDEEDLADAYLRALEVTGAGRGRFDAVMIAGDVEQRDHNLAKAKRLLGWEPRTHLKLPE